MKKKGESEKKVCYKLCRKLDVSCPNQDCRYWLDYEDDLNCVFNSVYINDGPMTLEKISKRLNLSITEVGRIEKEIYKRAIKINCKKEFSILKDYLLY